MYVLAVCVCVFTLTAAALWNSSGVGGVPAPITPPFPDLQSARMNLRPTHIHTYKALIRPPYCAPQIENSHTEGGRDKGSGREPKSSVVSCLTFPAGGTQLLTDRRLQLSIQLASKHAALEPKTEMFKEEDACCSVKNVFMGHL